MAAILRGKSFGGSVIDSGGASAVKEPSHFEVRKSSSQVTQMHFSPSKWTNKAVRYGNIFIFCSHYYWSKAIRRARQGGARAWARAVDLPARSFDLARPGVAPPLVIAATVIQVHKLSTAKSGRFAPLARKTGTGSDSGESADAANERERELRLQMELAEQEVSWTAEMSSKQADFYRCKACNVSPRNSIGFASWQHLWGR